MKRNSDSKPDARHVVSDTLRDILDFLNLGTRITGRGHDQFLKDHDNVLGLALEALVLKIGEAVSRLPLTFREQYPQVPWHLMKEMRNRLSHDYAGTDYELIWETVEQDFPEVKIAIKQILAELDPE